MISDVVEAVTFEIETWLKLRDRDFIKNPETRDFKICAFCRIFFSSVELFFQVSGILRPVLVVSYLQINKQNLLSYRNFIIPFLYNIQSL